MWRTLLASAGALALAACGDDGGQADQPWEAVERDRPGALLSVWGTSENDIWVVGGDARQGEGPEVRHYDGAAWSMIDSGQRIVDLWWVFGFEQGPVFASGTGGVILQYDGDAFERMTTPGGLTVFGMWGAAPDDMWAVGGTLAGGGNGFIWRYDGNEWTDVPLPEEAADLGTIWKVSGRSSDDVWMAATDGMTLHWDGQALSAEHIAGDAQLFSIAGNTDRMIAVGGDVAGVIYEYDGSAWTAAETTGAPLLSGVAVEGDDAYAVGREGTIYRRGGDGAWEAEDLAGATDQALHAAWIDPAGDVWAVGGVFDAPVTSLGVLLHKPGAE